MNRNDRGKTTGRTDLKTIGHCPHCRTEIHGFTATTGYAVRVDPCACTVVDTQLTEVAT